MRIIGGKDYYDGAGMGVDTQVVFVRTSADTPWTEPTPLALPAAEWRAIGPLCLAYGQAMAGGQILPFVEARTPAKGWRWNPSDAAMGIRPARWETRFVYGAQEAAALVESLYGAKTSRRTRGPDGDTPLDRVQRHFAHVALQGAALDWALQAHIATYVHRMIDAPRPSATTGTLWANTPSLAGVEAWQALDPATAHMRIAGWVGGVLASTTPMVELTDAARVAKAGFNARSFRADPQPTRRGH